jgi:hypothetical protein
MKTIMESLDSYEELHLEQFLHLRLYIYIYIASTNATRQEDVCRVPGSYLVILTSPTPAPAPALSCEFGKYMLACEMKHAWGQVKP